MPHSGSSVGESLSPSVGVWASEPECAACTAGRRSHDLSGPQALLLVLAGQLGSGQSSRPVPAFPPVPPWARTPHTPTWLVLGGWHAQAGLWDMAPVLVRLLRQRLGQHQPCVGQPGAGGGA